MFSYRCSCVSVSVSISVTSDIIIANQNVQWNVQKCGATEVWAQGVKGAGIIYGVIDSGVSFRHPILKNSYLGYDAEKQTFNHDWAWYDGVRAGPKSKEEEELTTPPATDAEGKESNENGHSAGTDGRLKQDTFNMTSTNDKSNLQFEGARVVAFHFIY